MTDSAFDHDASLTTVTTVNSAEVAEIIHNALVAADIPAQIDGEHQAGFTGALAIGIIVRECDVERALEVISRSAS